jgi:RNase adapter protein RapZ
MSESDDTLPDMATRPSRRPRLKLGRRGRDDAADEDATAIGAADGTPAEAEKGSATGGAGTGAGGEGERPPLYADSRLEDLVVITGYSGAGKSTAMAVFEDAGYFCVDNLPPEMIRALVELFVHEGSKVEHAAVVSDIRGGEYFEAFRAVLDDLAVLGLRHRVLFLDADEQTLLTRYKETRRRHPAAPGSSVTQGVAAERAVLEAVKERADVVIDSTGLKAHMLRRKIADEFLPRGPATRLAVTLESFGFKHGPARDADLVLDVRFLPNPHYEPALRPLTGHDARVVAYIERDGRLAEFYERVMPLLDFLLPQYVAEGKAHLTIAIGCTGGRHRSVAIAEHLGHRYARREDVLVEVVHRDADRASGYGDADPSGVTVEFAPVAPAWGEEGEPARPGPGDQRAGTQGDPTRPGERGDPEQPAKDDRGDGARAAHEDHRGDGARAAHEDHQGAVRPATPPDAPGTDRPGG